MADQVFSNEYGKTAMTNSNQEDRYSQAIKVTRQMINNYYANTPLTTDMLFEQSAYNYESPHRMIRTEHAASFALGLFASLAYDAVTKSSAWDNLTENSIFNSSLFAILLLIVIAAPAFFALKWLSKVVTDRQITQTDDIYEQYIKNYELDLIQSILEERKALNFEQTSEN